MSESNMRGDSATVLESLIRERARYFDVGPLFSALEDAGYGSSDVLLHSRWSLASAASLVESVSFEESPAPSGSVGEETPRHAIVELNAGLLSAQTPLPSHLLRLVEDPLIDSFKFTDFIHYFDHVLLGLVFESASVERMPLLRSSLGQMYQLLFEMVGLECSSTLHWLFQLVFPEMLVQVRRTVFDRRASAEDFILGQSALGAGRALGGEGLVPSAGFAVELASEEDQTEDGQYWPEAVAERLNRVVFPIIDGSDLLMSVRLTIPAPASQGVTVGSSHLGFEPMEGAAEEIQVQWFRAAEERGAVAG
jgi:predicted component of type VI protein secretion system